MPSAAPTPALAGLPLDGPRERCLHLLFEAQAARTPDAVALECGGERLSYADLNTRANRLAHRLRRLGVGPETRVGVCMARTPALVVALLGVLKAGGAYVPLDPAYPAERLAFMLEDSRAAVLLADGTHPLASTAAGPTVVDPSAADLDSESATNPAPLSGAENLAYLIYTSGSTGRPKGVAIEHRSAVALIAWAQTVFDAEELSGVLAATSVCFDLSVFELFAPLSCGGRVVLIDTILQLAALPPDAGVTLVNTVPSALAELLRIAPLPPTARTVNLAGEALPLKLVQQLYQTGTVGRVYNLYGPSEDTTYSTYALIPPDCAGIPPIGRPIANTQVYLLDEQLHPTPAGAPGELYLGGDGLARGYLGRPDLTAERFVPDPFGAGEENGEPRTKNQEPDSSANAAGNSKRKTQNSKLYKTGDLARLLPDGQLEYLGRIDQQVKIRGFRIELGEIEAVLEQHPAVAQAAVLAREDGGDKRLVAYIVPAKEPSIKSQEAGVENAELQTQNSKLRTFLSKRLPEHMVPAAFVTLDALPLNPNGKLDRRALPAPAADRSGLGAAYLAPRTPLEAELAAVWEAVLGVGPIGVHDHFLDLGGHSLKATRIVARLRQALAADLSVRSLLDRPTIAQLAELLAAGAAQGEPEPPLVPAAPTEAPPLSFAQQRFWFLDQLAPGNPAHHIPLALRLSGALDRAALERSLNALAARHETLRTCFADSGGRPVQIIAADAALPLELIDLDDLEAGERAQHARRIAVAEAVRPFDLGRGPLARARLLRMGQSEHILLLVLHHSISDDWSSGVLLRDLGALYSALVGGEVPDLPALPVQYADYAGWQRRLAGGAAAARQSDYWRRQLAGAPAALELPTDRPRPPVQTFRGAAHCFALPDSLAADLAALGRTAGVTLFMTLLAGFQTLLSRYSGQEDLVVGSPIAGRTRPEIEGLIGFFVNSLALRADLSGAPSFRQLLGRVRETALAAYANQDLPFDTVVEAVQPERHLSHAPLFQVMFALQNAPEHTPALAGLRAEPVEIHNGTSQFDLTLFVSEHAGSISGMFEYNSDLFDAATVARMAGHYSALLAAAAAEPDRPVAALPLLTAGERRQLLDWNSTARPFPSDRLAHELVAEQAAHAPHALAVADEHTRLSFAELDARAERLAHFLRAHGVGPDVLVGVCTERSAEMVLAELAVLKAGGAYVPMDPTLPAERLAFLARDARVALLLTQQRLVAQLPADAVRCVCLDTDWPAIALAPDTPAQAPTLPEHLAYLIYTSGSTGTPKGVAVSHASLLNLIFWHQRAYALTPDDRCAQLAGPGFDASVWEIWPALAAGAALHVVDDTTRLSPAALRDWLVETRVAVCFAPTPLAEELIRLAWPARTALRFLLTGGDRLTRRPPPGLPFALVNHYGPTECTVLATAGTVAPESGQGEAPPIGSAVANTALYVLDRQGQPVPVGVPGELHIGGAGLARGYWNRPDLTAERFVPNPFGVGRAEGWGLGAEEEHQEPRTKNHESDGATSVSGNSKLYRTGDLVRYRADGQIEFLGRIDGQIKLRGFRIELGEIEAVLEQHPAVKAAAALVREDGGDKRLVAYIVPAEEPRSKNQEPGVENAELQTQNSKLRTFLSERLPEYMLPAVFVTLAALPVTPNGKIDRRALPAPAEDSVAHAAYRAPETAAERAVAAVWGEVLQIERVGAADQFFALGGHSLLAIQAVARLRQSFQIDLSVRDMFEQPTVAALAEHIETLSWAARIPGLAAPAADYEEGEL